NLAGAKFCKAKLDLVNFGPVEVEEDVEYQYTYVLRIPLEGTRKSHSTELSHADFTDARISRSSFDAVIARHATAKNAHFEGCRCRNANFSDADLRGGAFGYSDTRGMAIDGARRLATDDLIVVRDAIERLVNFTSVGAVPVLTYLTFENLTAP